MSTVPGGVMIKKYLSAALLILLTCASGFAAPFELTASEQVWLAVHPEITVGLLENNPPLSMLGKGGVLEGVDPEVVKLLNEKLSGRLKIVTGGWSELYSSAVEKRLDVLMSFTPSEERRANFNYTRPYISDQHVIVGNEDGLHFGNLATLNNHSVALEESSFLVSHLREHYPTIKIREYKSALEALRAVERREVEAHVGSRLVSEALMEANGIKDLDFHGQSDETSELNVIAVRKDWPELTTLLDRALASIPPKELSAATGRGDKASAVGVSAKEVELTAEEIIWIQSHPDILVATERDWAPYGYVASGKAAGFSNDYMRLLAEKTGLNIRFVHGYSWPELLEMGRRKEVDVFSTISQTDERKEFLNFTDEYLLNTESLVVHRDEKGIGSLDDMAGKTLARIKGYSSNEVVRKNYPQIKFIYVANAAEALVAVSEGRADGFMEYLAVINYLRREHLIPNLQIVNPNAFLKTFPLYIGVRKDWPVLHGILGKAMLAVTPIEFDNLKKLWLATEQMQPTAFQLTPAETEWLKKLGTIRIGVSGFWTPFDFPEVDGTNRGISFEYMRIIKEKLGLEVEVTFAPWGELVEQTRAGTIDILPLLNDTEKRRGYLVFSNPVVRIPMIIGTRTSAPYYPHVDDLTGITVGLGSGYAIEEKLHQDYPQIHTKGYQDIEKALHALDSGKVGAVIANSAVFTYYQSSLGFKTTTTMNNTTQYEDVLSVGVRHELAPLVPLINRVLAGIRSAEHDLIMDKWTNLPVHKETDWAMVARVAGGAVVILLLVLYSNRKMAREIEKRKRLEAQLREANREMESFVYTVSHDLRTPLTPIIGYAEFLQEDCREILDPSAMECLAEIETSGHKMLALMEDLLALARVGRIERPVEPVDVGTVVAEVLEDLAKEIARQGVRVECESLPSLRVPSTFLVQLFDNLVGNALRYAGGEGQTIVVGGGRKGERVTFFVRDHGPGIPAEERGRIFEVFFRGSTGKGVRGTGIGLATVQKIAKTYGGRAWMEQTPGGGSTFLVEMVDVSTAAENEENIL